MVSTDLVGRTVPTLLGGYPDVLDVPVQPDVGLGTVV